MVMRTIAALCVGLAACGVAAEAHADGVPGLDGLETLANIVPAGLGGGVSEGPDGLGWSVLVTWPMQIPIGKKRPPFRFVMEPIASFGSEGTEFQFRAAPRLVVMLTRSFGLFTSAGTTLRFAPIEPSLHAELGARHGRDGVLWYGVRGDQWFAGSPEQRLVAMVGWSFY